MEKEENLQMNAMDGMGVNGRGRRKGEKAYLLSTCFLVSHHDDDDPRS